METGDNQKYWQTETGRKNVAFFSRSPAVALTSPRNNCKLISDKKIIIIWLLFFRPGQILLGTLGLELKIQPRCQFVWSPGHTPKILGTRLHWCELFGSSMTCNFILLFSRDKLAVCFMRKEKLLKMSAKMMTLVTVLAGLFLLPNYTLGIKPEGKI